jgi:hypothetical protein
MIKYQPFLTSVESGTKHYNSPFFYPGNVSISKWSLDSKQKLIDGKFLRVGTGVHVHVSYNYSQACFSDHLY